MRLLPLFLSILLLCGIANAGQKRYLVSSGNEMIPMPKGMSGSRYLLNKYNGGSSANSVCGSKFTFGFSRDRYPNNITNGFNARFAIASNAGYASSM